MDTWAGHVCAHFWDTAQPTKQLSLLVPAPHGHAQLSRTPRPHAGAAVRRRRRRAAARRQGGAPAAISGEFPLSRSRRPLLFPPPHPPWPDLEISDLFLALAFFCRWLHLAMLVHTAAGVARASASGSVGSAATIDIKAPLWAHVNYHL